MKINSYLAAALAALSILFSCSPEEKNGSWEDYIKDKQGQQDKKDDEGKQPDDGLVEIEVTAEIDASESYRSMLNPAWKAGDVIAATDGSGAIFKLTAQTDGASAVRPFRQGRGPRHRSIRQGLHLQRNSRERP